MKRFSFFILCTVLILLCSGCACKHEFQEADCENAEVCIHCSETQGETLPHSFGEWEYSENQMQRSCTGCNQTEQRELNNEERFHKILQGHWELHTATFFNQTKTIAYLRNSFWPYYADYDGNGTLFYRAAFVNVKPEEFSYTLTVQYSHFDQETNTHHASGISADGMYLQIMLEESDREPLLYLNGDQRDLLLNQCIFSKYQQILPYAEGTWTNIDQGKIVYTTLNSDWTFTADWGEGEFSGQWLPAPSSAGSDLCGLQLFYVENEKNTMIHGGIQGTLPEDTDSENNLSLWTLRSPNSGLSFRKTSPEQLLTVIEEDSKIIIGTWDSTSVRTYAGDDTKRYIVTDYSITVREDGTFTLLTDEQMDGTWEFATISADNRYTYSFTTSAGEHLSITVSGNEMSIPYKKPNNKYTTYLSFAQYDEAQWAAYLAGPELLPGSYVSRKITWTDTESGQLQEKEETGYSLTILTDGTVTGNLHQPVTGIWFYNNLLPGEGHSYIFRMDHTPPEQLSVRKNDGTLVFNTRIEGRQIDIYFYPQ